LTACTFLQEGYLLSRGEAQARQLPQSAQRSDLRDQELGIWNYVFLDLVDIHHRGRKRNAYGPVLFVIDPAIMNGDFPVLITKKNPISWQNGESPDDWYYGDISEFSRNYRVGDFRSMVLVGNQGGALCLRGSLQRIILDDPPMVWPVEKIGFFDLAAGFLLNAASQGGLDPPPTIQRRRCPVGCQCINEYQRDASLFRA